MNDQDERHELLGRLETPPEFKDWASNTLPTLVLSCLINLITCDARDLQRPPDYGRGKGDFRTRSLNSNSPLRGPADTGRLS